MSWYAREATSGYFKREWFKELLTEIDYTKVKRWVRAFDMAYSAPSEQNPHPDYTASVLMARMETGELVVCHAERVRLQVGEVEDYVLDLVEKDRAYCGGDYRAYIPEDPSAGKMAKRYISSLAMQRRLPLVYYKMSSQNGKLGNFLPFASAASNELIRCLKDDEWNDYYFSELEAFENKRSTATRKDDLVDATSLAYNVLATSKTLPKIDASRLRMPV